MKSGQRALRIEGGTPRILGIDVARGLALTGMMVIHFRLLLSEAPLIGSPLFDRFDGRPAALFMLLAGLGISLMSRRALLDPEQRRAVQRRLFGRAAVLLALGYLNLVMWTGDILRVYACAFALAAVLIVRPSRVIAGVAVACVAVFIVALVMFDYDAHWDWETLTYHRLWTLDGALRNLLYDGFRSVFPWAALLLTGMLLGRFHWTAPVPRRRLLAIAVVGGLMVEVNSAFALRLLLRGAPSEYHEWIVAWFGTQSMPPLPLFLLSALAASVAALCLSVECAERFPRSTLVQGLAAIGRTSLTWYITHIYIGLAVHSFYGTAYGEAAGILAGLICAAVAAALSTWWLQRRRHGPLEQLVRRLDGKNSAPRGAAGQSSR